MSDAQVVARKVQGTLKVIERTIDEGAEYSLAGMAARMRREVIMATAMDILRGTAYAITVNEYTDGSDVNCVVGVVFNGDGKPNLCVGRLGLESLWTSRVRRPDGRVEIVESVNVGGVLRMAMAVRAGEEV